MFNLDPDTVLWLIWIFGFGAIEGQALFRKDYQGTLTAHIRKWASMEEKGTAWRARRAFLLLFLSWLAAHFLGGPGQF